MGRPKKVIVDRTPLAEAFADFPTIDILERRLENPALPSSVPIRLVDEPSVDLDPHGRKRKWYLRWINTAMPQRFHTVSSVMGYVPVTWDELTDKNQIADRFEGTANEVRRGDRGQDLLMKIPYAYYVRIKQKQQAIQAKRDSPTSIKDQLQQEAALRLGPDAGEGVGKFVGDVKELPPTSDPRVLGVPE